MTVFEFDRNNSQKPQFVGDFTMGNFFPINSTSVVIFLISD